MSHKPLLNIVQSLIWIANEYAKSHPSYQPIVNQAMSDLKSWQYQIEAINKFKYLNSAKIGLSHQQRLDRRKEIAQYCREYPNVSISQVATSFNVGIATVNNAIKEYKDSIFVYNGSSGRQLCFWWYNSEVTDRTMNIINDLIDNMSMRDIATKYQLTRQRVHQIKITAVDNGVTLPVKPTISKSCVICNQSHMRQGKTCSSKCFRQLISLSRKIKAINGKSKWSRLISKTYSCVGCGQQFQRTNYQVSISGAKGCTTPKYCSQQCYYNRTRDNTNQEELEAPFISNCHLCHQPFVDDIEDGICSHCMYYML